MVYIISCAEYTFPDTIGSQLFIHFCGLSFDIDGYNFKCDQLFSANAAVQISTLHLEGSAIDAAHPDQLEILVAVAVAWEVVVAVVGGLVMQGAGEDEDLVALQACLAPTTGIVQCRVHLVAAYSCFPLQFLLSFRLLQISSNLLCCNVVHLSGVLCLILVLLRLLSL